MESHKILHNKTSRYEAGITLIEILITVGIIATIAAFTMGADTGTYRAEAFRTERDNLVLALQSARANALNNINQTAHGVAIAPPGHSGYVIFEGTSYESSDSTTHREIPTHYPIVLEPSSPHEVVFQQLSGNANHDGDILLNDTLRNVTLRITINHEGKISS